MPRSKRASRDARDTAHDLQPMGAIGLDHCPEQSEILVGELRHCNHINVEALEKKLEFTDVVNVVMRRYLDLHIRTKAAKHIHQKGVGQNQVIDGESIEKTGNVYNLVHSLWFPLLATTARWIKEEGCFDPKSLCFLKMFAEFVVGDRLVQVYQPA